jgi:hypothetical protein
LVYEFLDVGLMEVISIDSLLMLVLDKAEEKDVTVDKVVLDVFATVGCI